ncbi:hypothetical protein [Xanthocytophaga flava]|uniref:hypothetical protein n=1 Tax=Xanthocytophaga flava TaxID=3048013 RepID=UPI0028D908DC|nr:hypothetical protein [Xanthocytophaga flavus]MDJ1470306.1 hypothetical protein [Xanthocytophaga flavus]
MGYFSIIHPIVTFYSNHTTTNFSDTYVVGFPTGVNILKSEKIGFSFEITPFIRSNSSESQVTHFLFHPGILFRFKKGFTLTERLAFETSGRYGFTTIFSKVLIRGKYTSLFLAIPIPVRFGTQIPSAIGSGIQTGLTF